MFKGNSSVSFKCSKSREEVISVVEEQLEILGNISVSSSGGFNITGTRFAGFSYETIIDGKVSERDGRFSINIDFQAKPTIVGWLIAICFFPLGLAILILPNNAKGDIQRKADQALFEVKSILDEK
jgi:hypothetical protein